MRGLRLLSALLLCLGATTVQGTPGSGTNSLLAELLSTLAGGAGVTPSQLLQQAGLSLGQAGELLGSVKSIYDGVQDKFCTDPTVIKGGHKMPSILYGPQLNITLSAGNCSIAKGSPLEGKNVTCFGPSVTYSKAPISFVAKHLSPDVFVDGGCVHSKVVGPQKGVEVEQLYSAEEDVKFESMDHFLQALKAGGLASIWGVGSDTTATGTAAGTGAPLAAMQAALHRASGDTVAQVAVEPGSLEDWLQRSGWEVVMHTAEADPDNLRAPAPAQVV